DVPVALHVPDVAALGPGHEVGGAADGRERPHRRVDATRHDPLGPFEQLGVGGHGSGPPGHRPAPPSSSATSRAKYVSTTSAPARRMAVRCSSATAVASNQPLAPAAFTIAYSPDTW